MGFGWASWCMFLHLLLLLHAHGIGAREISKEHWKDSIASSKNDLIPEENAILRLHSSDKNENGVPSNDHDHQMMHGGHVHGSSSSHMDHMNPAVNIFFMLEDLKLGKVIPIYFPDIDISSSPHFLPREKADSIPFSSNALPQLLQRFSFPQESPQAKAMEDTIRKCETKPLIDETKICATSLESMLDFARGIFGLESEMTVLSTTHLTKLTTLLQNYTILKMPQEISAQKLVACHTMPYPYTIFYCHSQENGSKVFKVSLGSQNGDRVEAIAVCHMDTSKWNRNHISFRFLGIEHGTSPVCHFFAEDNLVWIPTPSQTHV